MKERLGCEYALRNEGRFFSGGRMPAGKRRKDDYRERFHGVDEPQYADGNQWRRSGQNVFQGVVRIEFVSIFVGRSFSYVILVLIYICMNDKDFVKRGFFKIKIVLLLR